MSEDTEQAWDDTATDDLIREGYDVVRSATRHPRTGKELVERDGLWNTVEWCDAVERLRSVPTEDTRPEMLERLWGLIANAWHGEWDTAPHRWVLRATAWRDEYHRWLAAHPGSNGEPEQDWHVEIGDETLTGAQWEALQRWFPTSSGVFYISPPIVGRADELAAALSRSVAPDLMESPAVVVGDEVTVGGVKMTVGQFHAGVASLKAARGLTGQMEVPRGPVKFVPVKGPDGDVIGEVSDVQRTVKGITVTGVIDPDSDVGRIIANDVLRHVSVDTTGVIAVDGGFCAPLAPMYDMADLAPPHPINYDEPKPPREPFEFTREPGRPLDLDDMVFQALGAASTCWENMSGTGLFDTARVNEIRDVLTLELMEFSHVKRAVKMRRTIVELLEAIRQGAERTPAEEAFDKYAHEYGFNRLISTDLL